jgi:hypothetical protein
MKSKTKNVIFFLTLFAIIFVLIACSEDSGIITEQPSGNQMSPEETAGCIGCHADATRLETLAIPIEASTSTGEG